MQVMQD